MKFRGLLIAVAVLAVLAGLTVWSNKHKKAEEGKSASSTPKLLSIPEDQFQQIRLQKADGAVTVVDKSKNNKWEITQPTPLPADQDVVGSMVSTLSSLSADRLIEDKATDLTQFGLSKPSLEVSVKLKDGKTDTLLLGDDTPTGGGTFAKLQSNPRVYTLASYIRSNLDKTPQDLRDKSLLTFDSDKLTRVDLQVKGQTVEFGKDNQNDWEILKPRPLRADGSQVEDLITKLKDAKMQTTLSDNDAKTAASEFASGTRVATASVTDSSGTQQLEVRKGKDGNYYARSSVVAGIYKVSSDLGDGLNKTLDDFRNKKLFDFGFNDLSKLEIQNGSSTVTYQKSGEKWMSGSKQMDSSTVEGLIDKLRDLTCTKFVEKGGGSPVFVAAVTWKNGKRVETVTISKDGNRYFAKRENEPTIYELDASAVDDLQKAASGVKEATPPKKK